MNVVVWRGQLDAVHVHSDWDDLTFVRATIHNFIFHQSICLSGCLCACTKGFFSHKTDLHAFYFYLNKMEANFSHNDVLQMIKLFVPFEFNVKTIFNTNLHLHWSDFCLFDFIVWNEHCEVNLFWQGGFQISCQSASDEVSYSTCDTIECFVLFFKVWELKLNCFAFSQDSCWF